MSAGYWRAGVIAQTVKKFANHARGARQKSCRGMLRAADYQVEGLERRLFLSSAIAAFATQQTFATGNHPMTVAVSDVNGDGKLDLAIANFGTNGVGSSVGVLLGNGNGTFQPQQTFAVGTGPYSVFAADVNGDGKVDLVTANYYGNSISVLLGNGNGTFLPQQAFAAGHGANSVVVADVNGDGKPDLVVANYGDYAHLGNTASVLLGNGNGTFQSQRTFATLSGPTFAAVADVNRDGKPDLLVANKITGAVSVLLGNGDGTFAPQQTFGSMSDPTHLVTADINDDGKLDLVVSSFTTNIVTILPGNGDGTFGPQRALAASGYPNSVAVADVNGDGKPDIVAGEQTHSTSKPSTLIGVFLGNGDGTFQTEKTFAVGADPTSVATADVNGDGRQDILVTNYASGSVSVLLGDVPPTVLAINRTNPPGPITTANTATYTVTFNEAVTGVDSSDFSVALSGVTAASPVAVSGAGAVYTVTISGILGKGTLGLNLVDDGTIFDAAGNPLQPGGVSAFQWQQIPLNNSEPAAVTVADVNSDGKPDLLIAELFDVRVMLGNGNGTFQAQQTTAASGAASIVAADLNGDGKIDLVTTGGGANNISVLLGNGDGTFEAAHTLLVGYSPASVAVSDFNGDGKPDLAVTDYRYGQASVLLGNGDGTFQAQLTFATGLGPSGVAAFDVNGDGRPDIVVANARDSTVTVLLGNGNGTFKTQVTLAAGKLPDSVAVADVNGDGKPDIVTANYAADSRYNYNTVSVMFGNGDGTFVAQRTFGAGTGPKSLSIVDVNGDGILDAVVTNASFPYNSVSVLLGSGSGSFLAPQSFSTGGSARSVAVSDINHDGKMDLVAANEYNDNLTLLLAPSDGSVGGQIYSRVPPLIDTINGTSGIDQIVLTRDSDGQSIDWTMGSVDGQLLLNDPKGLTVNGGGANDVIGLSFTKGYPLPNTTHLNGVFSIYSVPGGNPLPNNTLDIGRSTVYLHYTDLNPIAKIKGYLRAGYNNGGWNGMPTASTGVITSIPAAQNALQTTAIGYADSADGLIAGQPANTIELKYTLYGDTTLAGTVGPNDFTRLTQHYNQTTGGTWDTGDFNYDGSVNFNDFTLLTRNYNTSVGSQAAPGVSAGRTTSRTATPTSSRSSKMPTLQVAPTVGHNSHTRRHPKKHPK